MKDFVLKYASNDEQRLLLRKIWDIIRKSEKTYSAVYSHFLTPAEQALVSTVDEFRGYIDFDGGYDDAERRLCRARESEYCADDGTPIMLYSVMVSNVELSHRDILGSLMGLGLKREMVGDIIASDGMAQFFCHTSVAEFVELNLKRIGRYNVEIRQSELSEIPIIKTKDMTINVSSMRLDCIAAECFGLSRTKAADLIACGAVHLNWVECTDRSREVRFGDKISMRGKGKAEIYDISGVSRKGRLFVNIKKYI